MGMCVNQLSQQFIIPREVLWEMVILVSSFVHCLLLMRPPWGPCRGLAMNADHAKPTSNVAFVQWLVLVISQALSKAETTNWKCLPLLSYCKCEILAFFDVLREWQTCLLRLLIKAAHRMLFMFSYPISTRLISIQFLDSEVLIKNTGHDKRICKLPVHSFQH